MFNYKWNKFTSLRWSKSVFPLKHGRCPFFFTHLFVAALKLFHCSVLITTVMLKKLSTFLPVKWHTTTTEGRLLPTSLIQHFIFGRKKAWICIWNEHLNGAWLLWWALMNKCQTRFFLITSPLYALGEWYSKSSLLQLSLSPLMTSTHLLHTWPHAFKIGHPRPEHWHGKISSASSNGIHCHSVQAITDTSCSFHRKDNRKGFLT